MGKGEKMSKRKEPLCYDDKEILRSFLRELIIQGFVEGWIGKKAAELVDIMDDITHGTR
jgi:hypothetical protein